MRLVKVTSSDIEAAKTGQAQFLPLVGGGLAILRKVRNGYRLTMTGRPAKIKEEFDAGEGVVT